MTTLEGKPAGIITLKEAAALMRLQPNTVRGYAKKGVLPYWSFPSSNRLLFKRQDVINFIQKASGSALEEHEMDQFGQGLGDFDLDGDSAYSKLYKLISCDLFDHAAAARLEYLIRSTADQLATNIAYQTGHVHGGSGAHKGVDNAEFLKLLTECLAAAVKTNDQLHSAGTFSAYMDSLASAAANKLPNLTLKQPGI